jgi:SAM-dependent methyltransferase
VSELPQISDDVLVYYGSGVERDRLAGASGALELERTKELIERHLASGADVADVGGGTGEYAEWLASAGHRVELVDPVALHVEAARARAGEPARFGVHRADARVLPFADASFDAVLLLGPLYHLGDRAQRVRALREAARVTRSGGVVFAAAISRYASLFDAIRQPAPFPDAYFHLPDELADELGSAGLTVEAVYGVEGPGVVASDLEQLWSDVAIRDLLLTPASEAEVDPRLIGVSAHLLGVARKPTS